MVGLLIVVCILCPALIPILICAYILDKLFWGMVHFAEWYKTSPMWFRLWLIALVDFGFCASAFLLGVETGIVITILVIICNFLAFILLGFITLFKKIFRKTP